MARVKLVTTEQASPEVKEIYAKVEKNGAKVINLYRALAHNPNVLLNFMRMGNTLLGRTELSAKLRELAILRVANLTGSEYEWKQHCAIALQSGVSQGQIDAISDWRDSPNFNAEERTVLQYTEEVAQKVKVKDETFKAIRQYLSEQSTVELTLSIGFWGMVARFLVPLQVDLEQEKVGSTQEVIGRKR